MLEDLDVLQRGDGGDRVTTEGQQVAERDFLALLSGEALEDRVTHGDSGDRRVAGRQALRHRQHVGHDIVVLDGELLAGAAPAVDHFVRDQQHAVLVADLAQPLPVRLRRDLDTVRRRDRLGDDRGDRVRPLELDLLLERVGAGDVVRLARLDPELRTVVVRRLNVEDARHERTEVLLVAR